MKMRYYIVTPYQSSFLEICRLYKLNHLTRGEAIWVDIPDRLMGIERKNNVLLVHSDYAKFKMFLQWHHELTFIAKYTNTEVIWDAQIVDDSYKQKEAVNEKL